MKRAGEDDGAVSGSAAFIIVKICTPSVQLQVEKFTSLLCKGLVDRIYLMCNLKCANAQYDADDVEYT